ncbi:MAG: LuxR C-terminal-related transcriptional regulator, partial [Chloroflexota bacterium]
MGGKQRENGEPLTDRELEILRLIADGFSNQQIAEQLFLTRDTVKWYNSQIYQKLNVRSRTQAVALAREHGIFPRALPAFDHNLPIQSTAFIGRGQELADIRTSFANPNCRVLTLLGPGGIGKTRLALEAAGQFVTESSRLFADGFCFVPLHAVSTSDLIVSALAEAVRFQFFSSAEPKQQLLQYLHDKSCFLILDNFEHLLDGAPIVSEVLAAAPGIRLLVTSREAMNIQEEWLYAVQGMPYPRSAGDVESYPAVQLFTQNARRIRSDFSFSGEIEGIVRICTLTEGMPLALELASVWVRVLSCAEIVDEIQRSLDILETPAHNVVPRHRTMRAVLEHSWALLSETQREAFKMLAVFRGGFSRDAAQVVTGASLRTLSALVDKSWLRWNSAHKRYEIHELIRQYGQEHLSEDQWLRARDHHCLYFAHFLQQRCHDLKEGGEIAAYQKIELELENVRAYWEWAVSHQKEAEISPALESLWLFYDMGSRYQEGEQAFARLVAVLRTHAANPATRLLLGKVLVRQGALTCALDRFEEAGTLLREGQSILRDYDAPADLAFCLYRLSMTVTDIADPEWLELILASLALYREIDDLSGCGEALTGLGTVYQYQLKDLPKAIEVTRQALAACTQTNDQRGVATAVSRLARLCFEKADYGEARQYAQKSLAAFQQLGIAWGITISHRLSGWAEWGLGDYPSARLSAYRSLAIAAKYRMMRFVTDTLVLVANIHLSSGEIENGVALLALVEASRVNMGSVYSKAVDILSKLESELPAEIYLPAARRGRML